MENRPFRRHGHGRVEGDRALTVKHNSRLVSELPGRIHDRTGNGERRDRHQGEVNAGDLLTRADKNREGVLDSRRIRKEGGRIHLVRTSA